MMLRVTKIISGGQTGADRGGLDAAIALDIPHGGCCPKGRRAEDGRVPSHYKLIETDSAGYPERTGLNVAQADATLIFVHDVRALKRGSRLTFEIVVRTHKPYAVFDAFVVRADVIKRFLIAKKVRVVNVAGNRESIAPGIQVAVRDVLIEALKGVERKVTRVMNRRGGRTGFDVYVGRPSLYGNPFTTKEASLGEILVETRVEALRGYEKHLTTHPELVARARRELRGKTLACWCIDDLDGTGEIVCHAQILARVVDGAAPRTVFPETTSDKDLSRLAAALKGMGHG